ncbi:MAG: ComEC/Rec2 family competence protein [Synechococcaceae cyanobacterium]
MLASDPPGRRRPRPLADPPLSPSSAQPPPPPPSGQLSPPPSGLPTPSRSGLPAQRPSGLPTQLGRNLLSQLRAALLPRLRGALLPGLLVALLLLAILPRLQPQPGRDDPVRQLAPNARETPVLLQGRLLQDPRPLGVAADQSCRVLLQTAGGASELQLERCGRLQQGWRVRVWGQLRRPRPAPHPWLAGPSERLERQGIWSQVRVDELRVLERPATPIADLRRAIAQRLIAHAGPERGGLLAALVIGSAVVPLPADLNENFRASGLSHALAASGFHLTVLLGATLALARPLGRWPRLGGAAGAILLFLLLAGPQPSVVRAVLMGALALLLLELGAKGRPLGILALSVVAMLLLRPDWLLDVGFQLSVAATAGLLLTARPLQAWIGRRLGVPELRGLSGPEPGAEPRASELRGPDPLASDLGVPEPRAPELGASELRPTELGARELDQESAGRGSDPANAQPPPPGSGWKPWLAENLAVPLAACLWTLPLQLLHFGVVPLYAVPANLLAAPLLTPLTLGAMLLLPPALLLPQALPPLAWPIERLADLLIAIATLFARLPLAQCRTGRPQVLVVLLLSLGLLGLLLPELSRRWRRLALALGALAMALQLGTLAGDRLLLVHQAAEVAGRDLLIARHQGRAALIASRADAISCRQASQLALGLGVEHYDWLLLLDPVASPDPQCWTRLGGHLLAYGEDSIPLRPGESLSSEGLAVQALSPDSHALQLRLGRQHWTLLPDRQAQWAWMRLQHQPPERLWLGFQPHAGERARWQRQHPKSQAVWVSGPEPQRRNWPRGWQATGRNGFLEANG